MLTPFQFQELEDIITRNTLFYTAAQIGKHILTDADKSRLLAFGIDLDKIKGGVLPIEQAYLFGQLSTMLGEDVVKKMNFVEFKDYIKSHQWIPLNKAKKAGIRSLEAFAYNELKGLGNKMIKRMGEVLITYDAGLEADRMATIKKVVEEAMPKRRTQQQLSSELRERSEDWNRDWGRVSDYIMHHAFSQGAVDGAIERGGKTAKAYLDVYPGACKHCIEAYLTGDVGSRPKVFLVSELQVSGTNIGRKAADFKAVIPPMHSWCRCTINYFIDGSEWDSERGAFKRPKYKSKYKPKIHVTINGKRYSG